MTAPTTLPTSLRIGRLEVDSPVVLAPMAGVTNPPFRRLCRRFGGGLYVSEMVSARGLVEDSERTWLLASFDADEDPRSIQLATTDPWAAGEAVRRLVGEGRVDHVDLNFGCPVRKVTRNGGGAALPWKRRLFAAIVSAAVDAAGDVPVTVKTRVGIDDGHRTFLEAGRIAEDVGAAAIALHGRTASQWYSGRADWSTIGELAEAVTSIPVLGNGDIWSGDDAVAMLRETGCDGIVVGRGCLGKPWLFRELADALAGRSVAPPPPFGEVAGIMAEHAALLVDWVGEHQALRMFRRHAAWYCTGYPVGGRVRRRLSQVSTLTELDEVLASVDPAALPAAGSESAIRGHSQGPQDVKLPEGWLAERDDLATVVDDGAVSGG